MYPWLVTLHLLGLIAFLLAHAIGMWVSFQVRRERDRAVILMLLQMSVRGSRLMYVGLLALGVGGLGAAATADLLTAPWVVASYAVVAIVFVLMSAIAGFYYHPLRENLAGKGRHAPLDDEALVAHLQTRRPEILAVIGLGGLGVLSYLMSAKPDLW